MRPRRLAASFLAVAIALAVSRPAQAGDGGPPRWCVPSPEVCDGRDNDCDGQVDNAPDGGSLCDNNDVCVKSAAGYLCTYGCYLHGDDTPCQAGSGLECEPVTDSATGKDLGYACVRPSCSTYCESEMRKDANGNVLCAPGDKALEGCDTPPLCVCKSHHCAAPCDGTTCLDGKVCADRGPAAGSCVENRCPDVPCRGCDVRCVHGVCVTNPCVPGACKADEMCKPTSDYGGVVCRPSCADVCCNVGERCVAGACIPSCMPPCEGSMVCDESQLQRACFEDMCTVWHCLDDLWCDPFKRKCVDSPCKGVLCPEGQECDGSECRYAAGIGGVGGRSHGCTGSGGNGGSAAGGNGAEDAAAGGGCRCELGPGAARAPGPRWTLVAVLAAALVSARRRRWRAREGSLSAAPERRRSR